MRETAEFCIILLFFVSVLTLFAFAISVSAQTVIATVSIGDADVTPDSTVAIPIRVNNVTNLGSGTINVSYNPLVVHVTGVASGTGNALMVQTWNINNTIGDVQIVAWDLNAPHSGDVVFANLSFKAVASMGSTRLNITVRKLKDYDYPYPQIPHTITHGTFTITPLNQQEEPSSTDSGNDGISDSVSDESYDTVAQGALTSVSIEPITAPPDGRIAVPIMVNYVMNLGSGTIDVSYNPEIVHVTDVESGTGNALVVQSHNINNTIGLVQIVALDALAPHSGNVIFANVIFNAVASTGSTPLNISVRDLIDYDTYEQIPHSVNNGTFTIAGVGVTAYGVALTVDTEEKTTAPDAIATYYLTVQNTGNVGDTFDLSVSNLNNAAIAILSSNSVTLPAGHSTTILLNVTTPTVETYNVNVIATSRGNTSKSDTITTRTIATPVFGAPPEPEKPINPKLALIIGPIVVLITVVIALIYIKTKRKT